MSSRNNLLSGSRAAAADVVAPVANFECGWQPSRWLLVAYLTCQALALGVCGALDIPVWAAVLGVGLCLAHAGWCVPRQILLSHPDAFCRLRHSARGWELWNRRSGWQAMTLRRDSLALPQAVILRFRLAGQWRVQGLCLPADTLSADAHRRLRVRLKFSRNRWAVAE